MKDVAVIGAGMTKFGKSPDHGLKDLAREALTEAVNSAGIDMSDIQGAVVGNAVAGLITGQEMIRGQVVLNHVGIGGIPVINVENACASSSTALHVACAYIASGMCDVALALGMEKLYVEDKRRSFEAIATAVDIEGEPGAETVSPEAIGSRSVFMEFAAARARDYMERYGITASQLAEIAVKNHRHGFLNPNAQYRHIYTREEVLNSPVIIDPLTRLMCAPIGDGAAAAIICDARRARRFTSKPIFIRASVLDSGASHSACRLGIVERTASRAYEQAGVGPEELAVLEVHDATASGELLLYEELGLCGRGEAGGLIDSRATYVDGATPVNPSGGLLSRGHPLGATGLAQVYEIFMQLRGLAGSRQVHDAKIGLAENGGGRIAGESAALAIHIFSI